MNPLLKAPVLKARVIRPKGKEFEDCGILIRDCTFIKSDGTLSLAVAYFSIKEAKNMKNDKLTYIKEPVLIISKSRLVSDFEIMQGDIHNPQFVKIILLGDLL